MPAEVVTIVNGYALPTGGEPNGDLVEFLEKALEKARSGEIVGMIGVQVYPAHQGYNMLADSFAMGWTNSCLVVGCLEDTKFRTLQQLNKGSAS